jgi:hypothetical protein
MIKKANSSGMSKYIQGQRYYMQYCQGIQAIVRLSTTSAQIRQGMRHNVKGFMSA